MKTRVVLWWMLFVGLITRMLQTININIALVAMVKQPKRHNVNAVGYCTVTANQTILDTPEITYSPQDGGFDWTEQQQNLILSSFYWLAWAAEILGGVLSHKYGTKMYFGWTNLIGCVVSSIIPFLAHFDYKFVAFIRLVQGAIGSAGGLSTIIGQWAPPDERGKFFSVTLGFPLGLAIGYPLFGFVQSILSWEYVFHLTSVFAIIWFIFWYCLVYDTPAQHPDISAEERIYIEKSLLHQTTKETLPIPWKQILTSKPILITILCIFGQSSSYIAFGIYLPTYLKNVHNLDSRMIGSFIGLPCFLKAILQVFAAMVTDSMVRRGMSKTKVRNIAVWIGAIIPGFLLFSMVKIRCDVIWSMTLFSLFIIASAVATCGAQVAIIDMSPNFCGVIQGVNYAITLTSGFLYAIAFHYLSLYFEPLDAWGYFFALIGFMNVVSSIIFVLFSDSELQSWNDPISQQRTIALNEFDEPIKPTDKFISANQTE